MITKVEVRNVAGSLLTLTLADASNGFAVEEIEGLEPVKATLVSSSFANLDGVQYQSSRREARNIIIRLSYEPDYIETFVRDLRTLLYSFFMTKSFVELRFFMSDSQTVTISGRVESFDSPLFVREPKAVVSLMCFDPDFVELDSITIEGDTVSDTTEFLIDYEGSVETGIVFTLNVDRTLTEFTIYHRGPDGQVRTLDFAAELDADDILTINTISGSKEITLNRGGTLSSVLYGMSAQSNWTELSQGQNYIRVYALGDPIPFTVEYTTRHGGL